MKISIPPNHLKLQRILMVCPNCKDLQHCVFYVDPPAPPSAIQCYKCKSKWPLKIELLDHNPRFDSALQQGGIIIIPTTADD